MPRKTRTAEWYRKKSVELAKKIARTQANFTCEHCGKREPNVRTHGSHIFAEGKYKNMSADVDNLLCLAADCHAVMPGRRPGKFNWHAYPAESILWFQKKYPERWNRLVKKTQTTLHLKIDWKAKREELKQTLRDLEENQSL